MTTTKRNLLVPLLLGCLSGLPACALPKYEPNDPEVTVLRLVTVPPGARVYIPRLGLGPMVTPLDLDRKKVRTSDKIRIMLDGYEPWEGELRKLWQQASRNYKLELKKE